MLIMNDNVSKGIQYLSPCPLFMYGSKSTALVLLMYMFLKRLSEGDVGIIRKNSV